MTDQQPYGRGVMEDIAPAQKYLEDTRMWYMMKPPYPYPEKPISRWKDLRRRLHDAYLVLRGRAIAI